MPARGRPKGARTKPWADAIHKAVRALDKDGGRALETLAKKLVMLGKEGDISALKEIGDRLDGRAVAQVEATINDERLVARMPEPAKDADDWISTHGPH